MPEAPVSIIRVCPEHLCRIFNENGILELVELGHLSARIEPKRKTKAFYDHKGNECWWNDLLFVTDPRFPVGDLRHDVAREVHRHRTDKGVIGGSGRWDPSKSTIKIGGKLYSRFKTSKGRIPHCALCENGDMIPPSERFYDSEYRPGLPEVS